MRYLFIHAAFFALLGLSIVFPGTDGAPTYSFVRSRTSGLFNIFGRAPVPPPKFSPSGSKTSPKKRPPGIGSGGVISSDRVGAASRSLVDDPATRSYKITEFEQPDRRVTGDGWTMRKNHKHPGNGHRRSRFRQRN